MTDEPDSVIVFKRLLRKHGLSEVEISDFLQKLGRDIAIGDENIERVVQRTVLEFSEQIRPNTPDKLDLCRNLIVTTLGGLSMGVAGNFLTDYIKNMGIKKKTEKFELVLAVSENFLFEIGINDTHHLFKFTDVKFDPYIKFSKNLRWINSNPHDHKILSKAMNLLIQLASKKKIDSIGQIYIGEVENKFWQQTTNYSYADSAINS